MICKIRPAKPLDIRRLMPLVAAYYDFDSIGYNEPVVRRALARLLRNKSLGRVWVADSAEERFVGYLIMTYTYDLEFGGVEGIITEFFLWPNYRRQGLGARMIETVRQFCHRSRIGTIELQVSANNQAAISFYRTIGFKASDRIIMSIDVN